MITFRANDTDTVRIDELKAQFDADFPAATPHTTADVIRYAIWLAVQERKPKTKKK